MRLKIQKILSVAMSILVLELLCSSVYGQDEPSGSDEWNFILTPFVWLIGQDGKITIKGGTSDIDSSISDNIDNFDFGAQLYFEARKRKWGLYTETTYARSSNDTRGVKVDTEFVQSDFALLYRLVDWPLGEKTNESAKSKRRSLTFDGMAGGRFFRLDNETDIRQTGFTLKIDETKNWVDPMVGGRLMVDLTEELLLIVRGDIGGFGVNSKFNWSFTTFFGYELWENRMLLLGYRFLDVDFKEGSGAKKFEYDVLTKGPILGFVFRF